MTTATISPITETTRNTLKNTFIRTHGWEHAEQHPIPGDASFRHYTRLIDPTTQQSCICMDAPPPEKTAPFIEVTHILHDSGVSAPRILAQDNEHGFLLLEDLGNNSFTKLLAENNSQEELLYRHAINACCLMQNHNCNTLPPYSTTLLLQEVQLFTEWYIPLIEAPLTSTDKQHYKTLWQKDILSQLDNSCQVIVHRDYHADNLLWLNTRNAYKKVGIIDYQDAVLGHPAYDIVSLLEDARRDVSATTVNHALNYYFKQQPHINQEHFMRDYAILGAQRNLKIIGIFARLHSRDSKPHYLDYLPRVWNHLAHDIQHPALSLLKEWLYTHLPSNKHTLLQP